MYTLLSYCDGTMSNLGSRKAVVKLGSSIRNSNQANRFSSIFVVLNDRAIQIVIILRDYKLTSNLLRAFLQISLHSDKFAVL